MRSVRTTFEVLEAVANHQPIGLSELSRRMQLPKSTVHRSLAILADLGWIRPGGREVTTWVLGEQVRNLSEKVEDVGRLREAALPVLGTLNGDTHETIHLAVAESRTMRLIERVDSTHALRLVKPIGARSPLHAGSTGKSVLAHLSDAEIAAYLENPLEAMTTRTLVDPDALRTDIRLIRRRGYAISDEELTEGITSVAAAIRPGGGPPLAAISISGPTTRIAKPLRERLGALVAAAAQEVSDRLG